jgi:hypothetical protein
MRPASWIGIVPAVAGAAVAGYGVVILVTGRVARVDLRAFGDPKRAGLYYLCFGSALATLMASVLGNAAHASVLAAGGLVVSLGLVVLALRYRPRRKRRT